MAVVVFECPLDPVTLGSINELRVLRLEVLRKQINEIDRVLETLKTQGALVEEEKGAYREVVLEELRAKSKEIEQRIHAPETVYLDELELYIDVLGAKTAEL